MHLRAVCERVREIRLWIVETVKKKPAWDSGPERGQKPKLALYPVMIVYLR